MKNTTARPKKAAKCGQPEPTIQLMGFVNWTDPRKKPSMFVLDAPFNKEAETACLILDINLRSVSSIEVRPARRPLKDTAGVVEDAIRLANTAVATT